MNKANSKLFLSESTFHAKSILEKTGLFGQIISHPGIRGFIRFYFADIVLKKLPHKKWLTKPIIFVDFVLNLLVQPYRNIFMSKYKKSGYLVEEVEKVEGEIERFIEKHSLLEFVQKTSANFEWFKNYPWVKKINEKASIAYPFTHKVKEYELNYYVLKRENEIKAFVAISYRDNLSKIPYIYFDKKDIKDVFYSLMKLIIKKKYDSLVVFHPAIVDFMNQNKMPFLYRKTELKYSGTTKQIYNFFEQRPIFQDGDGDVIFT